jgi:pimeloyl-ACP methyl ester carboxylesterase
MQGRSEGQELISLSRFHVVAPSLPGIGYSTLPPKTGATVVDNARIFNTLMTEVLGYKTYVGQGGDFGAINLRQLHFNHSDNMKLAYVLVSSRLQSAVNWCM